MEWVDHARWDLGWAEIAKLEGGGQASAKRASRLADGQEAFLKILSRGKDPERRARFLREATAYDLFDHPGVPRLIESNAHRHRDPGAALYIAAEWIEGPTLAQVGPMSLDEAYVMTLSLLDVAAACHAQDVVHRDIKPDNVILRHGAARAPCLLDFGLTFHNAGDVDYQSETGQEIGNRFLRLPELAPNSPTKQDARSDLTFIAGLLLYVLTGQSPAVLLDSDGRLPHQRERAWSLIREVAGHRTPRLLTLFDQAFQQRISDRFLSAATMTAALEHIMSSTPTGGGYPDDLAALRALVDTASGRRARDAVDRFSKVLQFVHQQHHLVMRDLGQTLLVSQTGWDLSAERGQTVLYFTRIGETAQLLSNLFEVRQAGDELVLSSGEVPIFRTDATKPRLDMPEAMAVRGFLVAGLKRVMEGKD